MLEVNRIGLIGAMDEEIALLLSSMHDIHKTHKAGITFYEGAFSGRRIVLCKCGVGKVNAAVCTQILIDHYGVEAIIFTGVAGALDPSLEIGDIVISTACIQHDMDVTALGFKRGEIPFQSTSVFPADPALVSLASLASGSVLEGRVLTGIVLSGDQFIADPAQVSDLREHLGGACTEMEGAAVAQTCYMNKIPFVIIRSMSDKADGSAHVNFVEFTELASRQSYHIVKAMLEI